MADEANSAAEPAAAGPERKRRYWFPWIVVALAIGGVGGLELIENLESLAPVASRLSKFLTPFLCRVIVLGASSIALFVWFVAMAPARLATRLGVGGVVALAAAVLATLFRVDGFTGDVRPRVVWRFASARELPQVSKGTASFGEVSPDDYPEFLGSGRRATIDNVKLARDWQADPPKLLWRQPIGAGWSSFAVVDGYAVTQEQREADELVTCYEAATGKLCWSYASPGRFYASLAGLGPRATPTIHQGKIYALGALGHLACLDGSSGKPLWTHEIVSENDAQVPQWGKSCSPLVVGDQIIVSAGGKPNKSLVAYHKDTGALVWAAGDDASSYSSPTLLNLNGRPQVVIVNEHYVTAHDPGDGHVLWQHVWPDDTAASPNVSQPLAVGNDRLLLSKGYGIGSALWQLTSGESWTVDELWRKNNMKTKFTNAVIRDGHAYGLDEGVLSCIELATGDRKWKKGKYGHGQVILVSDLLLVQSETGDVALVDAEPEAYQEVARIAAVSGQAWNCPALAGRKLLLRTDQEAACYAVPLRPQEAGQAQ